MARRVRVLAMIVVATALTGPALAQDSGQGAAQGAGRGNGGASSGRSWADEVRSAIGRSGQGSGQGGGKGNEAPVRSDMQTGSTGKGAPGKPDKK